MTHRILLIITGSVAAYKALEITRALRRESMDVTGILTAGGAEFITPLAVSGVSGNPTYGDLFSLKDETEMGHIRLSREHDLILVAPASADFIAKMAQGRADDIASATLLASDKPVIVAPAMNHRMWEHKATQRNLAQITADGAEVIAPARGEMACGEEGVGRLAEVETIVGRITQKLGAPAITSSTGDLPLRGRRALVTSGPTQEAIDPVRFIGNRSSGKQGHAIAQALAQAGAEVTLISGPVALPTPTGVKLVSVVSAQEMHRAALRALPVDIVVCAAAVADWTVSHPAKEKLKKNGSKSAPKLELSPSPDILADISRHPAHRPALVIGFAAETKATLSDAKAKRTRKGCDWLLANDVSGGNIFGADKTQLTCIDDKKTEQWPSMTKHDAAELLVQRIIHTLDTAKPATAEPKIALEDLPTNSARVRYLAERGVPRAEIARQLGINYSHVSNALKPSKRKQRIATKEMALARLTSAEAKIRFLKKQGMIPSIIAKKLGLSPDEVKATLKSARKKTVKKQSTKKLSQSLHPTIAPQAVEQIRKDPSFPTQAARIRYMATLGMSRTDIAKALNIRYQTVRNTLVKKEGSKKKRSLPKTG